MKAYPDTKFLTSKLHRDIDEETGITTLQIPHRYRHYFRKAYRDWRTSLQPKNRPWK